MLKMRMPEGTSWSNIMPADLLLRLERYAGGAAAIEPLREFRPVVAWTQLFLQKQAMHGDALDLALYKDAKSAGKEVGGLESPEEQIAALTALDLTEEAKLVDFTLGEVEDYGARGLTYTEELIKAYCDGDSKRLLQFFDSMVGAGAAWARMSRAMLTDRNLRMAERIDQKLQAEPTKRFVFGVGAGHLLGATNMVDLLRARGYTVTRLPMTAANIDEELEQLQREVEQRQARIRALQEQRPRLKKAG
jgi:hypothetical protein